jgi:hypothetical protein
MEKTIYTQEEFIKVKENVIEFIDFQIVNKEFTQNEILETFYLIQLASKIKASIETKNIISRVYKSFDTKENNETFSNYYKRSLVHNIFMQLNKLMIISLGYLDKEEISKKEEYLLELFYKEQHMLFRNFITKNNILFKNNNKEEEYTIEEIVKIYSQNFQHLLNK